MKKVKVVELFAGVGGFRLGLENSKNQYKVIWSNQWEPSTKMQHASLVYEARFGKDNHINEDITDYPVSKIPDHDLLVGGFPCQDYSVATSLKSSKGLVGKKGVLWWAIHRILFEKEKKPKYLLLENVDRLLKSPSQQRGRDFAVMLKSLDDLGYAVEWRVINAAEYGMPQKRRRVFILGYHKSSSQYTELQISKPLELLVKEGIIAKAFPVSSDILSITNCFTLNKDIVDISDNFNNNSPKSPFLNSGIMIGGNVYSVKTNADYYGEKTVLRDIIQNGEVTDEFFVDDDDLEKWKYLKGAKKKTRKTKDNFEYVYSEGKMTFPDDLDKPSRTIITGEGGKSPSRFKHIIKTDRGHRRLTPVELEKLNMFPENHTNLEGITDAKRAFFMGNALVVGVVEKLGNELYKQINSSKEL